MATAENIRCAMNISTSPPFVELDQSFDSRTAAISPFADQLMRFIRVCSGRFDTASESDDEIEIAIREALANAVIHGNRENPEKKVYVTCHCNMDGEVQITVRDEGQGFDYCAILDPTVPERLLLTHGRGLHLMRALMDEVTFEENGTIVRMRKRRNTSIP